MYELQVLCLTCWPNHDKREAGCRSGTSSKPSTALRQPASPCFHKLQSLSSENSAVTDIDNSVKKLLFGFVSFIIGNLSWMFIDKIIISYLIRWWGIF